MSLIKNIDVVRKFKPLTVAFFMIYVSFILLYLYNGCTHPVLGVNIGGLTVLGLLTCFAYMTFNIWIKEVYSSGVMAFMVYLTLLPVILGMPQISCGM